MAKGKLVYLIEVEGTEGPVDPGYGQPGRPGVWPQPPGPGGPVDPGWGQGRPLPPHVGGGPVVPPGGVVQPPIYYPPEMWPKPPAGAERPIATPPIYLPAQVWPPSDVVAPPIYLPPQPGLPPVVVTPPIALPPEIWPKPKPPEAGKPPEMWPPQPPTVWPPHPLVAFLAVWAPGVGWVVQPINPGDQPPTAQPKR